MSIAETVAALGTDPRRGLTQEQARQRLAEKGPNLLAGAPRRSGALRLLERLWDPMTAVLLAAAVLSVLGSGGGDWLDAGIILLIVAVNAVLSISQENSAQKALEALKKLSAPKVRVLREGAERTLDAQELVPGDVLLLAAGDLVGADARLLESAGLLVDESAMTGESLPVEKAPGEALPLETGLGDRSTMVTGSTLVAAGRGRAVVTATGMDSEVGRVAGLLLEQQRGGTPLQRRMAEVSRALSFVCLCVCAVMFGVGLLQGRDMPGMFMTAVSLAVAAIPEGLSAVVTIVLALGVQRMAKRGAIVKSLPAVETLGSAGVICSDKTGTLTQNRMTVRQVWTMPGTSREALLSAAALCSDAVRSGEALSGEATETAILMAAEGAGINKAALERQYPRQWELPFDARRKRMTTVHALPGGGWLVCAKGAPDVLLELCAVTPQERTAVLRANNDMARHALRVIGVARRELRQAPSPAGPETALTFLGLIGMMDPPRQEAAAAVERCRRAGIKPVMITGDHKLTAVAVARELDIFRDGDAAVTGAELDFMPQELLERDVERFAVYARVSPEHKTRVVNAWRKRGKVVAMTGDGVNDAPALKAADIGCAMGRGGTEVARAAADMVLTDDNFATVVAAVEEGRGIYANISKAVHYLLSCNIGEILTLVAATALGFAQMPLKPVQLLWLNLVTDSLPALALGVEPVEPGVMERPPRQREQRLFTPAFTWELLWQGGMVGALTLAAYLLGERVFHDAAGANTMAFATLTLSQLFHAFNVRGERQSLFRIGVLSNPSMVRAFLTGLGMQLAVLTLPPLRQVFRTVPMTPAEWLAVGCLSVAPVAVCESVKWWGSRRAFA